MGLVFYKLLASNAPSLAGEGGMWGMIQVSKANQYIRFPFSILYRLLRYIGVPLDPVINIDWLILGQG